MRSDSKYNPRYGYLLLKWPVDMLACGESMKKPSMQKMMYKYISDMIFKSYERTFVGTFTSIVWNLSLAASKKIQDCVMKEERV
jgi:hypothetical protein